MVIAVKCVTVLWTQNVMALSGLTYAVRRPPGVAKFFDRGGALQKIFNLKKKNTRHCAGRYAVNGKGSCLSPVTIGNSGVPRNFFRGGVQQIQLRTEDRQDGDLGAVAP